MSEEDHSTKGESFSISTSRRKFLQATGMATLLPAASSTTEAGTTPSSAPSGPTTASDGPGRIKNLTEYLENPEIFEQNREPTHVTAAVPYRSVQAARDADETFTSLEQRFAGSKYFKLLDGDWDFAFHDRPSNRPDTYASSSWETIRVPSVWQTEGYDQYIYLNNSITWNGYDPVLNGELNPSAEGGIDVPDTNPTGTYRRTFTVPSDWNDREIFLHFEAVKQAYFVWVDNQYVGFQQGSMTPGEFDITDHVNPGDEHEVTVQAYRFSDGEALETIDMFRYSGIFRSVYLYSTPNVHLRDFYIQSGLDEKYENGQLRIDGEIANYTGDSQENYRVKAHLYRPPGETPGRGPPEERGPPNETPGRGPPDGRGPPSGAKVTTLSTTTSIGSDGGTVKMEASVEDPAKWSAEHPNLYTVVVEMVSEQGETTEAMLDKIGFRTYETTRGQPGAQVLVNGEPVNIRGVNRHETDPQTGRTLSTETMRTDLERMKQFNVNAVRTSHYPNDPTFMRLADEYGLYIQDEVNVETHWWEGLLASTEVYHEQAVARFRRMILRDRNHASVFSWSTGNEAGTGNEHLQMASLAMDSGKYLPGDTSEVNGVENVESFDGELQGLSPDRIMYHQPNGGGWNINYSDMLGPRYPDVDTILRVADGSYIGDGLRPVVMGEYNHAMGNSLGLVHRMWSEHIQPPVRQARDVTDANNDGVLVGSPTVGVGQSEGEVTFGNDDYLDVGTPSTLDFTSTGFTLAISFTGVEPKTESTLIARGDQYSLEVEGGPRFKMTVGSQSVTGDGSSNFAADEWHTLVGICTDNQLQLYLDGERLAASEHSIAELSSSDRPVRIVDANHSDGTARGKGHDKSRSQLTIDSVQAFERSLSGDEVVNGPESVTDGAILSYTFSALLRDKSLEGGFIWDWVNQDVTRSTTVDGEKTKYQFYDDDPFCLNGLVWSDRKAQPELWQLKHSHQPVKVASTDDMTNGEVYVTNQFHFTDLDAVNGRWELVADDNVVQSGTVDVDLRPGETRPVDLSIEPPENPSPGTEYWLNISFTTTEKTAYADANHEVARDQLEVPFDVPETPMLSADDVESLSVTDNSDAVTVSGNGFEYTLDKTLGTFSSMQYDGTELVKRGPLFNTWRAPIMNEVQSWGSEQASSWYDVGLNTLTQNVSSVDVQKLSDGVAQITVDGFLEGSGPDKVRTTPDATKYDNNGVLENSPTVVEGVSGTALEFDGTNSVSLAETDSLDIVEPGFTVEGWVWPNEPQEGGSAQVYLTKGSQYIFKRRRAGRGGVLEFASRTPSGWTVVTAPVPDNWVKNWHHIATTWDGSQLKFYIDGTQVSSSNFSGEFGNTSDPITIGAGGGDSVDSGTRIDSVRIYDRALDNSEVGQLDVEPIDGAVAWLNFDTFNESQDAQGPGFRTQYHYTVYGNSYVNVEVDATPNSKMKDGVNGWLPKVGIQLESPNSFNSFEWYGRGEEETYPDRKWGVNIGRYSGTVDEQYVPYLPPTDNGNKSDTRWATLSNGSGTGLLGAAVDESMNVNLNQYANLTEAKHQYELEDRGSVAFDLDHLVSGVGGTPTEQYDEYQVQPEQVSFNFILRPFTTDEDPMNLANIRLPVNDD